MTSELSTQVSTAVLRSTEGAQTGSKAVVAPPVNVQKVDATEDKAKTQEIQQQTTENKISKEDIKEAVNQIKEQMGSIGRNINFSFDEELDIVIIKVVNKDTEEVVRQFPSEELIEMAKHLQEYKGLILQEEA